MIFEDKGVFTETGAEKLIEMLDKIDAWVATHNETDEIIVQGVHPETHDLAHLLTRYSEAKHDVSDRTSSSFKLKGSNPV